MNTVGKLGSYITKGVYTVSGPFHPFGGAIDIIVVEQPDGSFKSSPWYVRFGKFQGVLVAKENMVSISVNGVQANFHMYLDQRGEAYFTKDVEEEEADSLFLSSASSDETERRNSRIPRPMKLKSCSYDSLTNLDDGTKNKKIGRSTSRRSRLMGMVFGRNSSSKDGSLKEEKVGPDVSRLGSLERAEIAADLLEIHWTTNLATSKSNEGSVPNKSNENAHMSFSDHGNHESNKENIALYNESNPSCIETQQSCKLDDICLKENYFSEPKVASGMASFRGMSHNDSVLQDVVEMNGDRVSCILENCNDGNNFEDDAHKIEVNSSTFATEAQISNAGAASEHHAENNNCGLGNENASQTLKTSFIDEEVKCYYYNMRRSSTLPSEVAEATAYSANTSFSSEVENSRIIYSIHQEQVNHEVHQYTYESVRKQSIARTISERQDVSPPVMSSDDEPITSDEITKHKRNSSEGDQWMEANHTLEDSKNSRLSVNNTSGTYDVNNSNPETSDFSNFPVLSVSSSAECESIKPNVMKRKARVMSPTSEQVRSLNLKEGKNVVSFTIFTPMLGKQEVDARIFLWKWDTRVVISDVDGTITKSDVLGQFMPLVGVDWSQTGVANLYSAIKDNGYQLLFLSARAISQAYHTRKFLFNIKQNGKTLPDGPVVISPDGLFPSLYREVVRRAPHEFKIGCLKDIKALFPDDCNPFYAGFGNRDTDEISYLKVGIPKGKIFIINPKGQVVVNRCVDKKSYHSLHGLVHGMFPSLLSSEQEDFNTWNFWKLPPPLIDV